MQLADSVSPCSFATPNCFGFAYYVYNRSVSQPSKKCKHFLIIRKPGVMRSRLGFADYGDAVTVTN